MSKSPRSPGPRRLGALLVGGTSARMGIDKATLVVAPSGERFVDVVGQALHANCNAVVLVGAMAPDAPPPMDTQGAPLSSRVIEDEGGGPLQALASFFALTPNENTEWNQLAIAPVDIPGLLPRHLKALFIAVDTHPACAGARFVIEGATRGEGAVSLPVVLTENARAPLAAAIERGERRLARTLEALDLVAVPLPADEGVRLWNVNTPEDYEAFLEASGANAASPGASPPGASSPGASSSGASSSGASPSSSRSTGAEPREEINDDSDDERERVVSVTRVVVGGVTAPTMSNDVVAEEEPLEIRVQGISVAITMRTPGNDEELVRGFLVTEGVVEDSANIARIAHCTRVEDPEAEDNVIDVTLAEGVTLDVESLRRNIFAHSSCGVCGKATLEAALAQAPPLDDTRTLSAKTIAALPGLLRRDQDVFARTGGLHAAGVYVENDADAGRLVIVREDVGRHNAIDKVVGFCSAASEHRGVALVVSGRVSFEVVQKAARARWPFIVAISAPTSLAVRLADTLGITLVGFVREGAMNVYSHPERVQSSGA